MNLYETNEEIHYCGQLMVPQYRTLLVDDGAASAELHVFPRFEFFIDNFTTLCPPWSLLFASKCKCVFVFRQFSWIYAMHCSVLISEALISNNCCLPWNQKPQQHSSCLLLILLQLQTPFSCCTLSTNASSTITVAHPADPWSS